MYTDIVDYMIEMALSVNAVILHHTTPMHQASFHKEKTRDAKQEFIGERIEGAVFFDIVEISDHNSSFPEMLPTPEQFEDQVGRV